MGHVQVSLRQAKVSNLLSACQDLSSYSGKFRGKQKRSDMRAQEAVSLIDETLNFFVKTTLKDEASMRQRLTGQKREELRRNRDHWKARAEDEERFQKMKEEAWRLFERQPGSKRKTRNEFEEEFGRKVRNAMGNSRGEQEKAVQKWSSEMQRAIQPKEWRSEARERTTMEQERSNLWEKLRRGSASHRCSLRQRNEVCASSDEKVYEFSVSIQSGRCHLVGVAPEACCTDVSAYHSSGSFAALYSHTAG